MAARPVSDEDILAALDAWERNGRVNTRAAAELGVHERTIRRYIDAARERGLLLSDGARETMARARLSGLEIAGGYKHIYDGDGKKLETVRWSVPRIEQELESVIEKVSTAFEGLTPAPPVSPPQYVNSDLLTVYPIADAHIGMLAWGAETGRDYDTSIAAERIRSWVAQCVTASPASDTAIILDVGDFTHADDDTYQTPRSKHVLDVDTRMFRTLDIGIATLASAVETALAKHAKVRVCILPGNHDSTIYLAVMFALAERYRDNPRVEVHKQPSEFFLHEFDRVMIAAHHGDKAPADRIVHFVADEFAEAWGRTKHRFLFTGHKHHHKSQDIGGMRHEQLRAVTERDAYAVSHAYTARAQLSAITYHKDRGEIQRVSVNA